jgi:carboxymethylenebutenolidase
MCRPVTAKPVGSTIPPWPDPEIGSWLTLPPQAAGQVPLKTWLALPPAGAPSAGHPKAGVLVLPEVFGINAWMRSVAGRLALAGYAALAVPLFARTAPALELGYGEADLVEGRSHKERTTTAELLKDLQQAADGLRQRLPGLPDGLGCVGFCFGGHVAMLAATLPAIAATIDCYGAGVATGRPGGGPPTLELLPSVHGRLLCVCGSEDPLIPPADGAAIRASLAQASAGRPSGREHRLLLLEAGHGFFCEARADFRPAAAALGWQAMLELFAESLG